MGWILCVWPEGKEEWLSLQAEKSYHSLSHSGDSATWLEVASGEVGYYSISFWPVMEIQTRKVAFAGVWYMFQNGAEGLSSDRDFFSPRFFTTENAFGNVYGCSQPELGFLVDDLPSRAPLQPGSGCPGVSYTTTLLFVESIVVAGLPILAVFRHCFWLLGCTSSHPNNAGFREGGGLWMLASEATWLGPAIALVLMSPQSPPSSFVSQPRLASVPPLM
ncbi:uncharacterized protein [Lolium perenne]|uniref:uncharacterized protein isoform X1 n=1 Tax=Lolium perenne TaxID=4522 RepID=UPI003A990997